MNFRIACLVMAGGVLAAAATAGAANVPNLVYIVNVQRPVPGHREPLLQALSAGGPTSKVQTGSVILQHLEGSEWTFATLTRYDSWQDLATERAAAASAGDATAG